MRVFEVILMMCFMGFFINSMAYAKKNTNRKLEITGLQSTNNITLDPAEIAAAISQNRPLEINNFANGCVYSDHANGFYKLLVTSKKKNIQGNKFALKGRRLGKIKTSLQVNSTMAAEKINILPDTERMLTRHSDRHANGNNCANAIYFSLLIQTEDLRKAKAGRYNFDISLSVLEDD